MLWDHRRKYTRPFRALRFFSSSLVSRSFICFFLQRTSDVEIRRGRLICLFICVYFILMPTRVYQRMIESLPGHHRLYRFFSSKLRPKHHVEPYFSTITTFCRYLIREKYILERPLRPHASPSVWIGMPLTGVPFRAPWTSALFHRAFSVRFYFYSLRFFNNPSHLKNIMNFLVRYKKKKKKKLFVTTRRHLFICEIHLCFFFQINFILCVYVYLFTFLLFYICFFFFFNAVAIHIT